MRELARESVSRREVVIGLDLGTTRSKALVRDLSGRQAALVETGTPWTTCNGGTETSAQAVLGLAVDLLGRAVQAAEQRTGPVQVLGVGVAGLGESGVLLDGAGEPCAPVIAWFDKRGTQQVQQVGTRTALLADQFARRTGLPWDCQASVAKLLWLQSTGLSLTPAHRWSSVPEWVVYRLGGRLVREPSLASRTGLIDQATGGVWQEGVSEAGLPTTLLPPPVLAGEAVGSLRFAGLPAALQGAALTVAGHDHPVAAIGAGAAGPDELFNSSGTADVVARSLPGILDDDRRELLVRSGLSAGAHALPATTLLLGGARGGLLLRRVLGALGAAQSPERDRLDRAALAVDELPPGLKVSGAGPTGDDVVLHMRDDVTPADIWAAATRYTADQARILIETINAVVGPHDRAVACGGWTRMDSVRAAKRSTIARLQFSTVREPGVLGAALLAAQAAQVESVAVDTIPDIPDIPTDHPISITSGGNP
jgi:sugar (pentulose or hexulose) kinase